MAEVVGKIEQLTNEPPRQDIADIVRDGMDKMYAEGFELAKLRAQTLLHARVEWLMKEAHAGGNWEHLKTRADEAGYAARQIGALKIKD